MFAGFSEIVLVLVLVMVFFGAAKVPKIMGSVGASVKTFREASRGEPGDAKDKTES